MGGKLKVNPPIRSHAEMLELKQCFQNKQIECFASDHAPHLFLKMYTNFLLICFHL